MLFNEALPADYADRFGHVDAGHPQEATSAILVENLAENYAKAEVADALDDIKNLCFRYATQSGLTISIDDVQTPPEKKALLDKYEKEAEKVENQFRRGIITDGERRQKEVRIWTEATDEVRDAMEKLLKADAVQPHRHDGGLRCPREHDAGPPDRRHARPGGQPPWRHDPPPDQVQLP